MKKWIGLFLFCCSYSAIATDTLIMTASKKTGQFVVRLSANPTTGYQWVLDTFDQKLLRMTKQVYTAPKTHLVGAGGYTNFSFQILKQSKYPKSTTLRFKYARAWEKSSGRSQMVIVMLTD